MKKKIVVFSLVLLFVCLCFVFNKYDLNISVFLTKYNNSFFDFLDIYGELPIYIGPVLFGLTYFYLSKKKFYKSFSLLVSFIGIEIASVRIVKNNNLDLNLLSISIATLAAILLTGLMTFVFSKIKKETLYKIKGIAYLSLLVSICSYATVEILKNIWGRVRFRDLSSDYHEFTNLFKINGINGNKSFPSGHTCSGTNILIISLIVNKLSNKKWLKYLTIGLCFAYIIVLAISRIIVSAHYASDVMVGFSITFITICISYKILKRKGVIDASSNQC